MTKEELIHQANRILNSTRTDSIGAFTEAKQFLKVYAGPDNYFFADLDKINIGASSQAKKTFTEQTLKSFIRYVENGLLRSVSLQREIQIETVSDYLYQAETLLNNSENHPAIAAILIGASLEEFLRNWLEELEFDLESIKNNLSNYAAELRKLDKIGRQDIKDITSWAGIRNDAAHGRFDKVNDSGRIKNMLSGVNLFMRRYSQNDFV